MLEVINRVCHIIEGVLIPVLIPNIEPRRKETKITTATDENDAILSEVHNVNMGHARHHHQYQYRKILRNPNPSYRDETPMPTEEGKDSRMARKVSVTQQSLRRY